MSDIWRKDGEKWSLVGPSDFRNEQELHDRIVEAPEMLPLGGQPQIVTAYREVPLGGGSADVLAFADNGRPVVIEVKLSRNAEARRAVVAQALAYAAALHRTTVEQLEGDILSAHLQQDGHTSLADALGETEIDAGEFYDNLARHLAEGSFRIVFVLDEAPAQLVRLTGYLEAIAESILVDLVTVSSYEVNGAQILLPQRVDPEHVPEPPPAQPSSTRWSRPPPTSRGAAQFRAVVDALEGGAQKERLRQLVEWAEKHAADGLWRLFTSHGKTGHGLLLRLPDENVTIAATYLPKDAPPTLGFWLQLGVGRRRAGGSVEALARAAGLEAELAQGKRAGGTEAITDELLDAIVEAYREASEGR